MGGIHLLLPHQLDDVEQDALGAEGFHLPRVELSLLEQDESHGKHLVHQLVQPRFDFHRQRDFILEGNLFRKRHLEGDEPLILIKARLSFLLWVVGVGEATDLVLEVEHALSQGCESRVEFLEAEVSVG